MKRFATVILFVSAAAGSSNLLAHGAHEHGVAQLQVGVSGRALEIQLESPAMNIVGFEHAAKNDAERAVVRQRLADLDSADLFVFEPAKACALIQADVTSDLLDSKDSSETDADDVEISTHADVDAEYRFACTASLQSIRVMLLGKFEGIESLRVQLITDTQQRSLTLDKTNATIRF